jgi:hypothetical protein
VIARWRSPRPGARHRRWGRAARGQSRGDDAAGQPCGLPARQPEDLARRLRHDTQRPLLQGGDPLRKLRSCTGCATRCTARWRAS